LVHFEVKMKESLVRVSPESRPRWLSKTGTLLRHERTLSGHQDRVLKAGTVTVKPERTMVTLGLGLVGVIVSDGCRERLDSSEAPKLWRAKI